MNAFFFTQTTRVIHSRSSNKVSFYATVTPSKDAGDVTVSSLFPFVEFGKIWLLIFFNLNDFTTELPQFQNDSFFP